MKAFIITVIAASVIMALAAPRYAYAHKHYKKYEHNRAYPPRYRQYVSGYAPERQIEYNSRTLPLGSALWWQQMERERGGRSGR
jgi:hypothetical protein